MKPADESEIIATLKPKAGAEVSSDDVAGEKAISLPDMPESVLDGRLGELYLKRMNDFPIALALPALLTAAGVLVEPNGGPLRANLYTALVGPAECGKTEAIKRANYLMDLKPPLLLTVKAGSAEGLLALLGDKNKRALYFPDELSHMFEKMQITSASFAYILNSAFYNDGDTLTVAHRKKIEFMCRLSIIGGIVDEKFGESFGSATTGGLYTRFLFGQCPTDFMHLWRPNEGSPAFTDQLIEAPVNRDIWDARDEVVKKESLSRRLLEVVLRCASICAAFDGRDELRAKNLEPAWELARYQTRMRMLLQPNPGKNHEAQVAMKILNYLDTHPAGKYLKLRDVLSDTHAYAYGPATCERAIAAMSANGEVEQSKIKNTRGREIRLIRRVESEE